MVFGKAVHLWWVVFCFWFLVPPYLTLGFVFGLRLFFIQLYIHWGLFWVFDVWLSFTSLVDCWWLLVSCPSVPYFGVCFWFSCSAFVVAVLPWEVVFVFWFLAQLCCCFSSSRFLARVSGVPWFHKLLWFLVSGFWPQWCLVSESWFLATAVSVFCCLARYFLNAAPFPKLGVVPP